MTTEPDIDPELFGCWPKALIYDGTGVAERRAAEALSGVVGTVLLDTKAQAGGTPLDELQDMLNGMTKELREQLQQFQVLRQDASIRAAQLEGDGDAPAFDRKQAQADAKASIDAMSVIVRTLEKIDSLQRTIADDRRMQAEGEIDEDGYNALVAGFEARIEQRADERARARFDLWKREFEAAGAAAGDIVAAGAGARDGPADAGSP